MAGPALLAAGILDELDAAVAHLDIECDFGVEPGSGICSLLGPLWPDEGGHAEEVAQVRLAIAHARERDLGQRLRALERFAEDSSAAVRAAEGKFSSAQAKRVEGASRVSTMKHGSMECTRALQRQLHKISLAPPPEAEPAAVGCSRHGSGLKEASTGRTQTNGPEAEDSPCPNARAQRRMDESGNWDAGLGTALDVGRSAHRRVTAPQGLLTSLWPELSCCCGCKGDAAGHHPTSLPRFALVPRSSVPRAEEEAKDATFRHSLSVVFEESGVGTGKEEEEAIYSSLESTSSHPSTAVSGSSDVGSGASCLSEAATFDTRTIGERRSMCSADALPGTSTPNKSKGHAPRLQTKTRIVSRQMSVLSF